MSHSKTIIVLIIFSLFISCDNKYSLLIGNKYDYDKFLINDNLETQKKLIKKLAFWESKFNKTPLQYPYLIKIAGIHENIFALNGTIENLKKAEKFYQKVLNKIDSSEVGTLHSLCRNYISQHKFKDCLPLLEKATYNGHKINTTHQIKFDVFLELGNTKEAKKYLDLIKNPKDFNYLIRKSKWEDHKGNLDEAIRFLELAKTIAERDNNKHLKIWSYSNLGDYYGHQGDIQKSYHYYLKTLKLDPSNNYVLKGIAWIQYAKNNDKIEANRILDFLIARSDNPNLLLFKAELANYNNDATSRKIFQKRFIELTNNSSYGVMFTVSRAFVFAENNAKKAVEIALQEVVNRPTPLSYDLLAWCYFKNKENKKALHIIQTNVDGFTFEPKAMLHTALIYKALNLYPKKVEKIKKELESAAFELGPIAYNDVKKL